MSLQAGAVGSITKLGKCVVCGDRVIKQQTHFIAEEGYCHRSCVFSSTKGP